MPASPARPLPPAVMEVLPVRSGPEPGGPSAAGLVGRCGELLALERAIRSAPSIAVVDGEAGIGKTRLVAEALARVRPALGRQLVGGCEPLSQPVPLGPVVDAIRRAGPVPDASRLSPLAATLRHVVPELAASLPAWPGPEPPPLDRYIFYRAVTELLGALGPAVLVLEDLQWCDPGTLDFLRCLVAGMPPELALVLTYRGEEVAPGGALRTLTSRCPAGVEPVRIRLEPLTATEVHELAARLVGDPAVSPALTARLHVRTGGIPFAVEETVRLVDERRAGPGGWDRATADELDAAGVPRGVEDVVRERVARLPADAQRVAEAAAVLAVPADIDLLATVSGVSRSRALLAVRGALLAAVLVEHSDGTYGHRHALATEAVHASIPRAEREVLHRRAAAALKAEEPPPYLRLARHLRECGSVERWTKAADAAADVALEAWDPATAARVLVEVLPAARVTVRERARMALKAARAATRGGACRREAAALLRGLLDQRALPRALRGEVRHVLGDLLLALGDTAGGRRELLRCVEDLRDHTDLRVHTLATLAIPWVPEGEMDDHLRDARAAVAELPAVADPAQRISVLTMRAQALVCVGDPDAWKAVRAIPWRSTAPETQTMLMWAAGNLIDPWFHLGEYATARGFLRDTARRSEALRSPTPPCLEAAALAIDWAVGTWNGLDARARSFVERHAREPLAVTRSRRIAGLVALADGRLETAEVDLRTAYAEAEAGGTVPGIAAATAGLVRCRLAMGDGGRGLAEAELALDVVRRKGIWAWAAELAPAAIEAHLSCGAVAAAAALAEAFDAGLRGLRARLAAASATLCRALVAEARADTGTALRELERAERLYAALPRPYDAAHVAARRGALLLAAGDTRGAQDVSRALECFTALGATADAARVRRVLRRHSVGAPPAARRGRIGYGAGLTPRQMEIAALAADGHTNPEIASRLGLSPRTVGNHLALAMNKLGVRSRTVLARRWDRRTSALRPEP